jgi:hypothetical protein
MLSICLDVEAPPKFRAPTDRHGGSQILREKSADDDAPQREKPHTICKGTMINVIGTLDLAAR